MDTPQTPLNERLLRAWLRTITILNSDRIASELPLNESIICNILYQNERLHPDRKLTATDLCRETKIKKSQMNRTLKNMERRQLIRRERSLRDRRNIYIIPIEGHNEIYWRQHSRVLAIVDNVIDKLGEDEAGELLATLHRVCDYTEEFTEHD